MFFFRGEAASVGRNLVYMMEVVPFGRTGDAEEHEARFPLDETAYLCVRLNGSKHAYLRLRRVAGLNRRHQAVRILVFFGMCCKLRIHHRYFPGS